MNMMGAAAAEAIGAALPDVEVIEVRVDEDPPDGVKAEVMFGGYSRAGATGRLSAWLDAGVKWVEAPGTGIDNLPAVCFEHGRTVTCARGLSAVPISEWVLAQILTFEKRLPSSWMTEPPDKWAIRTPPLGELYGQTLGLVGLGGIGEAVAVRALAFGMRVVAVRRTSRPSAVAGVEVLPDLDQLLAAADHLVLAAPGTPATLHLLDARAFSVVKPGVHLVNIARGGLVDQDALREALDDGRVAMASLDTVTPEPLPAGHWLYTHPSVRLSGHWSYSSSLLSERNVAHFIANARRYARGEPLIDVVDQAEGY